MGSLKALQEWCRLQCQGYSGVEVRDMSASFRDGLAFCAIIHRHRPDLIDFDSLSEENVYENNRLAFEVAESQLGIPALLDPEDMVSMKVPDRLSIITYVSQYYNFFNDRSTANPPSVKRLAPAGQTEPALKKPLGPKDSDATENESVQPAQTAGVEPAAKRSTLSSTCSACHKHVHLVQRFLVDGKLYHRNCFRCTKCHSTLLPGSYKLGTDLGALVCSHHLSKQTPPTQNGASEVGKKEIQPARTGGSTSLNTAPNTGGQENTPPSEEQSRDSVGAALAEAGAEDKPTEADRQRESEEKSRSSSPPNPFEESDEEETQSVTEEGPQTVVHSMTNGELPSTPENPLESSSRPVPAPRKVSEAVPPPRPAPRARLSQRANTVGEHQKPPTPPKPRERSESPASGSHKPKDPPWLVLVQSEQKKKKARPPPPPGPATPSNTSLSTLQGEGSSRPSSPSHPSNPFEEDDDNDEGKEEEGGEGVAVPPSVSANHPWYRISQAPDLGDGDTSPQRSSPSTSASPGSAKSKKRPAPRAPKLPARTQACPPSQASSCSPSPALSTESLSSCSDHGSSPLPLGGSATSVQEQSFTKSVSEPSIASSDDTSVPSSSPADSRHTANARPHSTAVTANASSAPNTPQTNRSSDGLRPKAPPPRPSTTPSPLVAQSPKKICKENPFNRKASPSPAKTPARPPMGPRPARPPAPGYGFPLIKRKVQSDDYIPVEDIHGEMAQLEKQLDELELRGVELEKKLRSNPSDEDEEHLLVDWFTLIHDKHLLIRREAELVYTAKQQNLEERQADVEYELRCLLNKPEKDWTEEDKSREQELMADLVTIIEQRNQIVNSMDQDRQREEEEDKLMQAMLKKKDFHRDPDTGDQQKRKGAKFKPIKALKLLSHKKEKS
ncbi:MICAL-like protein 1 isoform X2 [Oryzias latipes]|uniref:MICAL-like 1a n=1 Tax=Oryzias latipes TaxID=8090 RepID=H2MF26_ORYLA|nr:MICAL-like protein 1 isoform X2 [Oryzias latipes]